MFQAQRAAIPQPGGLGLLQRRRRVGGATRPTTRPHSHIILNLITSMHSRRRIACWMRSVILAHVNCVITAGPTYEPLDEVRRLTNFSTGRLGSELATYLTSQ